MEQPVTQQDTQPPAETLAWRLERIADDGGPLTMSDKGFLRETARHLAALTRRAGGDAIPAGEASGALGALEQFVVDHSGNDDTADGMEVDRRAQEALSTLRGILAATSLAPAIGYVIPAEEAACRFDGIPYSRADLKIAQRAACAIVPLYGTGEHGEQESARSGVLWNDHPAVQGALRALHEARIAYTPEPPAGGDAGAVEGGIRCLTCHSDVVATPGSMRCDCRLIPWSAALALPAPVVEGERWRHVKRGTVYEVIGYAELQNGNVKGLREGAELAVYRGEDGKLWARERGEFHDGRFTALSEGRSHG